VAAREDGFIRYRSDRGMECRRATPEEAIRLQQRERVEEFHVISPPKLQQTGGLTIILRGSDQLEMFPQAKAAYLRAAATWEALIRTPITVIIDVDFGPNFDGEPFDPDVLGQTKPQSLSNLNGYPGVREALISGASTSQESALYGLLPASPVPTSIGNTNGISTPSASLRALGILDPVADPASEPAGFGPPPTIGLNSAVPFDFDPSNGIDFNATDFDAVVVHEMGHALGFSSWVGLREIDPDSAPFLTVWDLFRLRPGVTLGSFPAAQRILSPGGVQIFFDGALELGLSTGRVDDGSEGDGFQAAHWKESSLTGQFIGIMDPAIASGERNVITQADLTALDFIGYRLGAAAPIVNKVVFDPGVPIMVIKGSGMTGELQIEVNDVIVAPPLGIKIKGAGKKLKIRGTQSELNLRPGVNSVVVIRDGAESTAVLLNL
jgi:hypothetical protein